MASQILQGLQTDRDLSGSGSEITKTSRAGEVSAQASTDIPTALTAGDDARRCTLLFADSLDWGPEEFRLAAAVIGNHAREQFWSWRSLHDSFQETPYAKGMLAHMLAVATDCARQAWHYALQAETLVVEETARRARVTHG